MADVRCSSRQKYSHQNTADQQRETESGRKQTSTRAQRITRMALRKVTDDVWEAQ